MRKPSNPGATAFQFRYLSAAVCCLLLASTGSLAQQKPARKDSILQKKSHWVTGLSYLSNNVYLGRKDSISTPYISPSIGYHSKSGFFVTGAFSWLLASGQGRVDVVTIEGGYSHTSDHFNIEASIAKDFYNDQSFSVSSEIGGRLGAYLSYDLDIVEPSLDLGLSFGSSSDFGLGFGLAHNFSLMNDQLGISPSAHVNLSTQNYYNNYYSKRRYSAKGRGRGSSVTTTSNVAEASRFQVMDYEISAPVEYTPKKMKQLKFSFTPTLALPVNPATIADESSGNIVKTTTESLSNSFYFSVGVNYSF